MAGRRPKPTRLKIARGNPGGRKLPQGEPEPPEGLVEPPAYLTDDARAVWGRLAPDLLAMKVLRPVDATTFGMLCALVAKFEAAPLAASPAAVSQIRGLAAAFGIEPASRARINVGEAKKPASDWDELTA